MGLLNFSKRTVEFIKSDDFSLRRLLIKKIVFVHPPLTMEERYSAMAKAGTETAPLGLCNLAAVTRAAGYETKIIDASALGWDSNKTVEEILKFSPDFVGITAVTIAVYNAGQVAKKLKEKAGHIITILGGPHITCLPLQTMQEFSGFDVGVIGEGEITIQELLPALGKKEDLSSIKGIIFRKDGELITTQPRPLIDNLDLLPLPAWDALPELTQYYRPPVFSCKRLPATSLVTSRGCSGQCTFCDRRVFGNRLRGYSAKYLLAMIRQLMDDYGIKEIIFHDDNFVLFRKRLKEFCETLIKEKWDLTWSCNTRVDSVNQEVILLMARAGCWQIGYGIESGSQRILDVIKKRTTIEQIEKAVKWSRDAGIRTRGFFMLGHPTETKETMRETIDLAKRLPVTDFQITFFTPLPGTEVFQHVKEYGTLEKDWRKMNMWVPVFIPYGLTREDLVRYHRMAFKEFYFRPKIIFSYLKLIKSPEHLKRIFSAAGTLLKSFFVK